MTIYPQDRTIEEQYASAGEPAKPLSVHDVEKIQALYPDYQIELREGKIIII